MEDSVMRFYDRLADSYHLLFEDWQLSARKQGEILDRMIRNELGDGQHFILDCCCGIGTQAIGLALRGHRVHGTDLSESAIVRARSEAERAGVAIEFGVADLRGPRMDAEHTYDVVIACDNALPHLLTDEELSKALANIARVLRPAGLFIASIRDYDQLARERPTSTPVRVFDGPEGRRVVFQVWDWTPDGRGYHLNQFIVSQAGAGWQTEHFVSDYRALQRYQLNSALHGAGMGEVRWLMPGESGYYQPIVLARDAITQSR
jgi:SAM-dependent methyltransferase